MKILLKIGILTALSIQLGWAQSADSTVFLELNFELDSYQMADETRATLDSLIDAIPFGVIQNIEIYGHTDSLASKKYNRKLSRKRVESVLHYLVYNSLDPLKVKTDYYGENRPKYKNTPQGSLKNRRVEMVFVINTNLVPPAKKRFLDQEFLEGHKLRLPNVTFVGNQPLPNWESFETLTELLTVMYRYPDMEIRLEGHVCCSDYQVLSEERARAVYDFLVSNGVNPNRMTYQGYSNKKPLFKERTEADRKVNRRVEMVVLKNSGRKVDVTPEVHKDMLVPLLSIKFPENSSRFTPAGDFMLSLIADAMKKSEGLHYEILFYNNIGHNQLTTRRANTIGRALRDMGVSGKKFNVRKQEPPRGMPFSANQNKVRVKITEKY